MTGVHKGQILGVDASSTARSLNKKKIEKKITNWIHLTWSMGMAFTFKTGFRGLNLNKIYNVCIYLVFATYGV